MIWKLDKKVYIREAKNFKIDSKQMVYDID